MCGWPVNVVADARRIELSLRGTAAQDLCFEVENDGTGRSKLKKQLKELSRDLVKTVKSPTSVAGLRSSLETLKAKAGVAPKWRNVTSLERANRQPEDDKAQSHHPVEVYHPDLLVAVIYWVHIRMNEINLDAVRNFLQSLNEPLNILFCGGQIWRNSKPSTSHSYIDALGFQIATHLYQFCVRSIWWADPNQVRCMWFKGKRIGILLCPL